jgi:hypothetical protein
MADNNARQEQFLYYSYMAGKGSLGTIPLPAPPAIVSRKADFHMITSKRQNIMGQTLSSRRYTNIGSWCSNIFAFLLSRSLNRNAREQRCTIVPGQKNRAGLLILVKHNGKLDIEK